MKKILLLSLSFCSLILLTGCTTTDTTTSANTTGSVETLTDGKTRLSNGFIQYTGEPTREDTSYYIVEDICGQFTTEFVSNMLGKEIVRTEGPLTSSMYSCTYYFNNGGDEEFITLVLDYSSIGNPTTNDNGVHSLDSISMANYVAMDDNEKITTIYLILSENKYMTIFEESTIGNEGLLSFARNLANEIKDYK